MTTVQPLTKRQEKTIAYITEETLKRIKEARLAERKRTFAVLMYEGDQDGGKDDDFVRPHGVHNEGWVNAKPSWLRNDAALAWRYFKAREDELKVEVKLQPFLNVGRVGPYVFSHDPSDFTERFMSNTHDGLAIVLELK